MKAWILVLALLPGQDFDDLKLRSIGPAVMGGRIGSIAVVERDPSTMYAGTASGGLWKTTNNGTTWTPVFDHEATSSIGDVAVAPSDPQTVWVGTGEANNRQSSSFGVGVYLSQDAGRSWMHRGLRDSGHIGEVVIDPNRPERVFVAALGSLWTAGGERGVFRTSDAGSTWENVLAVDDDTGATTLAMDPSNASVLYAATYQRRRTPWGFAGGGPGSGLYRTVDGGEHWTELTEGLPEGELGRIGVAVFAADPRVVYALVEHASESGLYRSDDRGDHWTRVSELNPRPMYYSKLFLDPRDANRVYVLGSSFHVSDDGGRSFETNRAMTPTYDVGVHGDHHALWIDPRDTNHLVLGGDGGLYFSWDRSHSWRKINNMPIAQFYAIAVDMDEPYNVYAGAQDTHSWTGPSATRHQIGILNGDWRQTNFGDGMYQQADPTDPTIAYTESQGGNLVRLDRRTGNRKAIKPYPDEDDVRYRFHWTSPLILSPHDPTILYFGGNRLFVSRNRGDTWSASPDLTRAEDRDELEIMGAVPTDATLSRHDGVGAWGTITSVSESPLAAGTVYVGTDDGRVQLSRDHGETWISLESRIDGFDPLRAKVSRVAASYAAAGRAYVTFDRHDLGDFEPYVFVTENFGDAWTRLVLPDEAGWVNVIVEHPRRHDLLFVGTETGLWMSLDRGERFVRMTGDFPTVPVDDLVIHPRDNDLVVGTHGRSVYILDDLTPLERYDASAGPQLFTPLPATTFMPWKHESYGAQAQFVGDNPPFGSVLTYYLPEAADAPVAIEIQSGDGTTVRTLEAPSTEGFHRIAWDLRSDPPVDVERASGPLVPDGSYRVILTSAEARLETTATVVLDERMSIPSEEFRQRYEFLKGVNGLREDMARELARVEALQEKSTTIRELLDAEEHADVLQALKDLEQTLTSVKAPLGGGARSFRNPSVAARAGRLFDEFSGDAVRQGSLHGPTDVQRLRATRLEAEARTAIAESRRAVAEALPAINELLAGTNALQLQD